MIVLLVIAGLIALVFPLVFSLLPLLFVLVPLLILLRWLIRSRLGVPPPKRRAPKTAPDCTRRPSTSRSSAGRATP